MADASFSVLTPASKSSTGRGARRIDHHPELASTITRNCTQLLAPARP